METTPLLQLPFPSPADKIAEYPPISKQLAELAESLLTNRGEIQIAGETYPLSGILETPLQRFTASTPLQQSQIDLGALPTPPAGYGYAFSLISVNPGAFTWLARMGEGALYAMSLSNTPRSLTIKFTLERL